MERYFFHMVSKHQTIEDEIGRELRSLSSAHEHAVRLIQKATTYLSPEDTNGWTIQIVNSTGRVELVVLFSRRGEHIATRRPMLNRPTYR
jgi:hypothetical protein